MSKPPAGRISAEAQRISEELPYTPDAVQLLIDTLDGDFRRAQIAARLAASMNWSISELIRMQALMGVKLAKREI